MINLSQTLSEQYQETSDDYESYGLTLALDTIVGSQSLSPYFMLSKSDYKDDADSFSFMYGIGGNFSVGERNAFSYGYLFNDKISTSVGLGYSDSDAKIDAGNDNETYDLSLRLNLSLPWAYFSIGEAISFNDYKKADTSISSNRIRSDATNTFDIMLTKALGDLFPRLDPNRGFFINLSYEKIISEANILNYDYIADSYSLSFSRSFKLN